MKVLIFGATGMVGQGVLRECLLDASVEQVTTIVRHATGRENPRLREIVLADLWKIDGIAGELAGCDACFFCLGITSAGMTEDAYARVTYDLTMKIATLLAGLNPAMTFVYVSGAGTDSTGRGRFMWARVKGRTENALLALPFKAAFMFRPGAIQPLHGITSKTRWYRVLYALTAPLYPVLSRLLPDSMTTTERVGRAMLAVAQGGFDTKILETRDINRAGR
jgi:uncharacterized protein YbjT (DUF2867 family)